jgi:hypothetical protein
MLQLEFRTVKYCHYCQVSSTKRLERLRDDKHLPDDVFCSLIETLEDIQKGTSESIMSLVDTFESSLAAYRRRMDSTSSVFIRIRDIDVQTKCDDIFHCHICLFNLHCILLLLLL